MWPVYINGTMAPKNCFSFRNFSIICTPCQNNTVKCHNQVLQPVNHTLYYWTQIYFLMKSHNPYKYHLYSKKSSFNPQHLCQIRCERVRWKTKASRSCEKHDNRHVVLRKLIFTHFTPIEQSRQIILNCQTIAKPLYTASILQKPTHHRPNYSRTTS